VSVNEYEASLVIKSGAELLLSASSDPRSDEGYAAVKANMSEALELIAEALANLEAGVGGPRHSTGWAQDLRRVADDLVEK
jgi:predicted aminopeptidase